MTLDWDDLPKTVREAVKKRVGAVTDATTVRGGQNCDVATVLRTAGEPVFLKGVHGVSRRMRFLRNEADAGRIAVGVAPALLFSDDVDDWFVVGFEYVHGRDANLAPNSDDLGRVAATLQRISTVRAPHLRTLRDRWSPADSWKLLAALEPETNVAERKTRELSEWSDLVLDRIDGDRLVHTDLHGGQFLVGKNGDVHVVDWGWPAAGADWIDTAFVVIRLVESGHRPDQAEEWAKSVPSWSRLDRDTVTAFAVYVAGLWSYRAATARQGGAKKRAAVARRYATWLLASGT
jgi:hypothetical protein